MVRVRASLFVTPKQGSLLKAQNSVIGACRLKHAWDPSMICYMPYRKHIAEVLASYVPLCIAEWALGVWILGMVV